MSATRRLEQARTVLVDNLRYFASMMLDTRPRKFCIASFFQGAVMMVCAWLLVVHEWAAVSPWCAIAVSFINMKVLHSMQDLVDDTSTRAELGNRVEHMRSINWLVLKGKWATPEEIEQLHRLVSQEWDLAIKAENMYVPEWTPVQQFVHQKMEKLKARFAKI